MVDDVRLIYNTDNINNREVERDHTIYLYKKFNKFIYINVLCALQHSLLPTHNMEHN